MFMLVRDACGPGVCLCANAVYMHKPYMLLYEEDLVAFGDYMWRSFLFNAYKLKKAPYGSALRQLQSIAPACL